MLSYQQLELLLLLLFVNSFVVYVHLCGDVCYMYAYMWTVSLGLRIFSKLNVAA